LAGKRKGFHDTRGTLFFDIARILSIKKPQFLVLENVKGLLSHDKGRTLSRILTILSKLGYQVEYRVLNSKDYGVPQNRERIFITGHLGGSSGSKILRV
jgi:DNA (cytosine-5)-methyltransferase 1